MSGTVQYLNPLFRLAMTPVALWSRCWLFLRQCTEKRARINTLRKLLLCVHSVERLNDVVAHTKVAYDGHANGNLYL